MEHPEWFQRSLAIPFDEQRVEVDGAEINYLDWGTADKPGLVLVHGGAAHAHWWAFLAPFFNTDYHVVALDLSGHGDSGRRDRYSHDLWSEEILAVAADAGFPGPPVVVGHSLGGLVTINTAALHGERMAGAVIVDSPVRRPDPESETGSRGRAFRSPGTYPTLEAALDHFRLIPPQPCDNDFIVEYVGRRSLHEVADGWTWKFDPHLFTHTLVPMNEQLASVATRVALFRGEHSVVVPPDTAEYMYEVMGRASPVISIPDAHHHLILDQPLAFVAALRTLLADWLHSEPISASR
ncbi:MAG: alpha/beta hydrolase [Acidimicrobiia bacterium]|nr:alpha/beta hydrolase [Acidimicrobiia bacterium]